MKIKTFIKNTAYVIVTILSICLVAMTMLTALAAEASESTALEREQARIQWIAEHGEYQPNLTESAKQEAMAYTNIKQKELDDERKKTYRVDVEEINGMFKASFFVNGRLIHKTYPQHSKQNALMFINRHIERYNTMYGTRFRLIGDNKPKAKDKEKKIKLPKSVSKRKFLSPSMTKSLGRFDNYINQRQSKQDDKDFFIFLDLKQMFGVHHATAMTAVCRGELPQPKTLIINGSRVKGFQFDDVNNFFEIIRGVSNGKPTSTMGTQNVQ